MSQAAEEDNKTEEPTEKRIRDAIDRGQTPFSREVPVAATLLATALVIAVLARGAAMDITHSLARLFENASSLPLENAADATAIFRQTLGEAALAIAASVAVLMAAGLAASLVQGSARPNAERIAPDLSRISLNKGLRRLFSSQGVVEFLKGVVKIAAVCLAGYAAIYGTTLSFTGTLQLAPDALAEYTRGLLFRLTFVTALIIAALAAFDFFWTSFSWLRNLRMTRQELKDEFKQTEGDQMLKARFRSLARSRLRKRMLSNVQKATVVVTNPTHFAVALRYIRHEGGSPKVMAKGKDHMALRIRKTAEDHNIPVVEDKRLARSLYESVEVDQFIPPEFYRAVAEIIIYLQSRPRSKPSVR